MNNKRSSNSFNKLFFILSMVWVGVALLSTFLFLGASLVTKDLLNITMNSGTTNMPGNLGLSNFDTPNAKLSGIGIAAVFFLVIALISSIVLIVLFAKFQPNFISKTYFYWTIGITLFVLIFTTIIAFLGSPWNRDEAIAMVSGVTTGKKPIIANMITVNINNSTNKVSYSLGGGAISILLVDIVFVCGIIVSIANLIARYVKANKNVENLSEINIDQLNLQ